jgi:hypothetical protein
MKANQSLLLEAIQNGETKTQMQGRLASAMWGRFKNALRSGFWFCDDCQTSCERIEDDHGQPAHCHRCGSHRIAWTAPIIVEDTELIHPGEL